MLSVKRKVQIARALNRVVLAGRQIVGKGATTCVRRRGVVWALDLNEGIDLSIYLLGAYEPKMLRTYSRLIEPGHTVFDIGANVGSHTLHFARLVGQEGRVHAFEPTDYAFAKLKANLSLNPSYQSTVRANQVFLLADPSVPRATSLYSSWPMADSTGSLHEAHLGKSMPLVAARSLTADEYCSTNGITRIDFVKIDVDGNEFSVLKGFRSALARFRPRILIEIAPFVLDEVSSDTFAHVVELLVALRYDFFDAYTRTRVPADIDGLRALLPKGGSMNALLEPSGG